MIYFNINNLEFYKIISHKNYLKLFGCFLISSLLRKSAGADFRI